MDSKRQIPFLERVKRAWATFREKEQLIAQDSKGEAQPRGPNCIPGAHEDLGQEPPEDPVANKWRFVGPIEESRSVKAALNGEPFGEGARLVLRDRLIDYLYKITGGDKDKALWFWRMVSIPKFDGLSLSSMYGRGEFDKLASLSSVLRPWPTWTS